MKKKSSFGKTLILVASAALIAGGAVVGGFAIKNYLDDNAIPMPWNNVSFNDTFVGVRLFKDGKTKPVRIGVGTEFKAGINGARNDFDAYPVYSKIKASKDKDGETLVSIPEHWYKIIDTENYTEICIAPNEIDGTYVKKEAYKVGAYQGNVTYDSKGKGTLHSNSGAYAQTNRSKLEFDEYSENADSYLVSFADAMDINLLMTVEFATDDLQEVFQGVTDSKRLLDQVEFDFDLQDEGKTNVFRVSSEAFDAVIGEDEKIEDYIIPGFTSFCVQESDKHATSTIATVTGVKKVNYKTEEEKSSSSASSSGQGKVNCYEISFDKTIKYEDEFDAILNEYRHIVDDDDAEPDSNFYAQFGTFIRNGLTDGLKGSSHELTKVNGVEIPEGNRPFAYRGIENWWGNVTEFVDGVQARTVSSTDSHKVGTYLDICLDKTLMRESDKADAKTPDYVQVTKIEGTWAAGISENKGVVTMGTQANKAGSLHDTILADSGSILIEGADTASLKPVCRGATFFGGQEQGAFFLHGQNAFDDVYFAVGSRIGK